ncbi:hypothetical protein [Spiroplasma turonicum]|uniref:Transmembrane protein n=1 Tax=Spiroplasma turonicum TaxID=216946 RepID=A0A0K1P5E6_9MOLU|nr:hypothetical protein [Spiroplasma turonicum]AKU79521.1 hypothetical protein STURON_00275 [Spiroplasma turonicum]ALX70544.1 hypothetical protein STURO_v1c02760 [Spiroplasma turonicum]
MVSLQTIVIDSLSALGLFFIVFTPLYFCIVQGRVLNGRLHTKLDGEKLFEKLKTDLRLSKVTGINKKRLYKDLDYASTIFRGAMEYNSREVVWFFNEYYAKQYIKKNILSKAWLHFLIWAIFIGVVLGGVYLDGLWWLFNVKELNSSSGKVSTFILFFLTTLISALIKYFEYYKVKKVVNDDVRQINLVKKEKVWKDYKIIYFISIGTLSLGYLFIFINMIFK